MAKVNMVQICDGDSFSCNEEKCVTGKWIELETMLNEIRLRTANVACFLSYMESIFKYMYIFTCMYIHMFNTYCMLEMKMGAVRREQWV